MKKILTLILCGLFSTSLVFAQTLLTENFNYPPGQLTNVSNGSWVHLSGDTNFIQVDTGNLTYPGYSTESSDTSGMVMLDTAKNEGEDAYTRFGTVGSDSVFCSFLLNVNTAQNLLSDSSLRGDYFIGFLPTLNNSSISAGVAIKRGTVVNTFNLGVFPRINDSIGITWVNNNYNIDTTHLITLAYTFVAGDSNNVISLWVNPSTDSSQSPAQLTVLDVDRTSDSLKLGKILLHQGTLHTPICNIDAIKVSKSWAGAVLPLQLLSFNVIDNNGYASLRWQTCNEINVNRFDIQRSENAIDFVSVANISAANSTCGTVYTYNDTKALSGTAYYRIRIVDNDGSSAYSSILSITGKIPVQISVFPNPVVNNLVVLHPKAGNSAQLQVMSINGKLVLSERVMIDAIQSSVDVSKLGKGNYIVIFTNGNDKQTLKFMKQ